MPLAYASPPTGRRTLAARSRRPLAVAAVIAATTGIGAVVGFDLRGLAVTHFAIRGIIWQPGPHVAGTPPSADQLRSDGFLRSCLDRPGWPVPGLTPGRLRAGLTVLVFGGTSFGFEYVDRDPQRPSAIVAAVAASAADRFPGVRVVPDGPAAGDIEATWPTWVGGTVGAIVAVLGTWAWHRRRRAKIPGPAARL